MDFVVIEIFYLLWFSLTLGTFGSITRTLPLNQAVFEGTENVPITCFCSGNADNIKWSFTPVGSTTPKSIKDGSTITDNAYYGSPGADDKSYTLTVRTASSSTAGTYTCDESTKFSVLLIVLNGEASCDYSPRDTSQLSCKSTLRLRCTVSYIADTTLVSPDMTWSTDKPEDESVRGFEYNSTSGTTTTETTKLDVKWPEEEEMPIYKCKATFTLPQSTPGTHARFPPETIPYCQPFTSPVPCMRNGGNVVTPGPMSAEDPVTDAPKATGTPEQSLSGSVRSAETSNLAIQVLGVAGVLLLAQMF